MALLKKNYCPIIKSGAKTFKASQDCHSFWEEHPWEESASLMPVWLPVPSYTEAKHTDVVTQGAEQLQMLPWGYTLGGTIKQLHRRENNLKKRMGCWETFKQYQTLWLSLKSVKGDVIESHSFSLPTSALSKALGGWGQGSCPCCLLQTLHPVVVWMGMEGLGRIRVARAHCSLALLGRWNNLTVPGEPWHQGKVLRG